MKHMLITGGAGGIGHAVSQYFSRKGWKVYSCDVAPQEPADENIIPVAMDVGSSESVVKARALVEADTDRLDTIINLAGIYIMDSLVEVSEEDFLRIFNINVNGAYRVNKEFLTLVKKSGRIIIITSELSYLVPLPFNGIYHTTKTTLESYAYSLRSELALLGVPVITIRPGAVGTRLLNDSLLSMEKMCKKTRLYGIKAERFQKIMKKNFGRPMTQEKLAEKIYKVAVASHPRASYTIGARTSLRLFSALPVKVQAELLKKLLK